ncbi:MAG: hypothetical protein AB2L12_16940 [Smithellaceae bacterium]
MPGKIYPREKEKLLQMLSAYEIKIIQKDYPLKQVRNAKIHELIQKGASCKILAELTGGLSKTSVHRIGQLGGNARDLSDTEQNLKRDLVKIQAAVDSFYKEIKKILNKGGGIKHGRENRN